nr:MULTISPECIES: HAD family phosphatase [Protofrankia]
MGPAGDGGLQGRGPRGRGGVAAVLFDMDGLLVDTEPLWTVAEHELAASLGARFTPEIKAAMIGHGVDTALPLMLSMLGVPDADPHAAARFLIERTAELFGESERIVPMPGAVALLDALAAAGIAAALVSSSFRVLMDPVLAAVGADRFAVTVAGDEVSRRKPHPEPYLTATRLLGADPARCVVLEDSEAGARAGLDAGCPTIFVPSLPSVTASTAHPLAAELTVRPSLHEVTVDLLDLLATQPANADRP